MNDLSSLGVGRVSRYAKRAWIYVFAVRLHKLALGSNCILSKKGAILESFHAQIASNVNRGFDVALFTAPATNIEHCRMVRQEEHVGKNIRYVIAPLGGCIRP